VHSTGKAQTGAYIESIAADSKREDREPLVLKSQQAAIASFEQQPAYIAFGAEPVQICSFADCGYANNFGEWI